MEKKKGRKEEIFAALSIQGTEKKEQKEYFILDGHVVSVNLLNRRVSLVKELPEDCEAQIKFGILVWKVTKDKVIYWENLNSGESGKFFGQDLVSYRFFVVGDGIILNNWNKIYKMEYTGNVWSWDYKMFGGISVVTENNGKIYLANMNSVICLDSETGILSTIYENEKKRITALEKDGNEVCYFVFDDDKAWNRYYHKYSVDGTEVERDAIFSGTFAEPLGYVAKPIEIVTTKNFKAHNNVIFQKNSGGIVWGSSKGLSFISQAVSIYDKDIIFCCASRLWDKDQLGVTMFDLSERSTPVFLPLEGNV